ncbi:Syntaxin-binding protein 5 [Vitis vinifera]|uniref:Syntaxin-binding protein 5 n=2 Tax=Vitis vinifera TaxID=29760 RepID=A0A438HMQ4_VITVI|nr:Syntaxin-binding protein 5 [Vitis vinifera]
MNQIIAKSDSEALSLAALHRHQSFGLLALLLSFSTVAVRLPSSGFHKAEAKVSFFTSSSPSFRTFDSSESSLTTDSKKLQAMFVKKLVEKASKKPGGSLDGLKSQDVDPRLVFHYGIPGGSILFAYDSIQKILAIATRDGRIKLFGKDNTQALLESNETVPSKFLQVWDIDKKLLSHVHVFKEEITSFMVMQRSFFMYLGDSSGNISVLKLEQEPCHMVQMKYTIPSTASHGNPTEVAGGTAVMHILPQPTAESKRVLIIFRDGLIVLWDIRESKVIFKTGVNMLQPLSHDTKTVTSACWACPFGGKVVVGYSNGDVFIWNVLHIPDPSNGAAADKDLYSSQSAPIYKLNLGYKLEKIPIASLKWAYADGKATRLYVMGGSDIQSTNLLQCLIRTGMVGNFQLNSNPKPKIISPSLASHYVILLNEQTESRTIKLGIHLPEPCVDMVIVSSSSEQSKHKQDSFLLLGKSGCMYAYDDYVIEKYLLQCQSRSSPSLPKEIMVKLPFSDSSITIAKFITENPNFLNSSDEDYVSLAKSIPPFLPSEAKPKDETRLNSTNFGGFAKIKNLYITGHSNGAIYFWDLSCPFLLPILSLKQQSEDDLSLSGIALTALYFDGHSRYLISGDQNGMVRIFKFKTEAYATATSFMPLQGIIWVDSAPQQLPALYTSAAKNCRSTKKGSNHIIQSVKLIKVNGSVLSIDISRGSRHLAIGSDQGYVSLIDMESPSLLYQKLIESELSTGVISVWFETCILHGFEKNILAVATKDSSILALDSDTGNTLSTSMIHPKKPSKALFMQILDGHDAFGKRSYTSENLDLNKGNYIEDSKQLSLLLCSEKAAYVYSLTHVIQGIKKVHYKKKFNSSCCCWASTFYTPSDAGLVLIFTNGKIEIRSLPELSLLKETSIKGLAFSTSKSNPLSNSSVCSSRDGEIIVVNGDQEMFALSSLLQNEIYRPLDSARQVYRKDLVVSQEGLISGPLVHKEKKKVNSMMKLFEIYLRPSIMKLKVLVLDSRAYLALLLKAAKQSMCLIWKQKMRKKVLKNFHQSFSVANFPLYAGKGDNLDMDEEEVELDIDDIDLEDPGEKPKGQNMMAALNKQKLTSKFQALKGKLKHVKLKNEKSSTKEEPQDEKAGAVDQIKKKYGFPISGESSVIKMAESKLNENLKKLQGINIKTTEMQDTAKSFSFMAKQVLRAEQDKQSS